MDILAAVAEIAGLCFFVLALYKVMAKWEGWRGEERQEQIATWRAMITDVDNQQIRSERLGESASATALLEAHQHFPSLRLGYHLKPGHQLSLSKPANESHPGPDDVLPRRPAFRQVLS